MTRFIRTLGLTVLATLAIPAFAQDSIAPPTFSATIPIGTSATVNKVVTIGQVLKPVDILFVVDTTGSMGPTLSAVATGFSHTVTTVGGFASNVQFGVEEYKDFFQCAPDGFAARLDANLTSTTATVQNALNGLSASGGCDDPESNLYGLYAAANGAGVASPAGQGFPTGWRAGSTRIIVWVGDNAGHDPAGPATEATTIAALQALGAYVIAASASSGPGLDAVCDSAPCGTPNGNQAMRITAAVGGADLGTFNPATIVSAIETAIENAIAMYSSVGLGVSPTPAGVSVGIGPTNPITGTFNRSTTDLYDFTVTFTGTLPGVYSFATNALLNGAVDVSEQDTITVTAQPPSISKAFGAPSIPLGGNTTLTFTITNPNAIPIIGVSFGDLMPAGLTVTGETSDTCGGVLGLSPTAILFSGGTIPAAGSCTISITVLGTSAGVQTNVTSNVSANIVGTGNTASATLDVVAPPIISKAFNPAKIVPGGTAAVSFSITNPNNFIGLTGVAFTDSLPSGLVVASPNGLSSTCGGTATATAGSGTISLTGGAIASGTACVVTVNVTAPEGIYLNSVQVTSTNGGTGNSSSATLFVATPPNLSKVFGEVSIGPGASTTLSFTLMNPNHIVTLHALQFADVLPAGLVISTPSVVTGTCGGGTITAPAGSSVITVGSAVLAPQASCTFSVNVTSDGTVLGLLTNITSTVTSTEALPGDPASAIIFIGDPFQVSYAADLNIGESYINIANTGTNGAPLLGPGLGAASGNICVNVYAFDPAEELISCCSCLVTPDQTVNLGVVRDLTSKTLTGVVPTSVTLKLLVTLAGPGGGGNSCTNTAATASLATLANGGAAWGTTLHATPTAGSYATTERTFTGATLSAGELASITGRCAAVIGNGSGFGVCSSCKSGALGGANLAQ